MTQKKQVILIDGSGSMQGVAKDNFKNTVSELAGIVEEAKLEGRDVSLYAFGSKDGAKLIANTASTPEEVEANITALRDAAGWGTELTPALKDALADVSKLEGKDRRGIGFVVVSDGDLFDEKQTATELNKILENPKSTVDVVQVELYDKEARKNSPLLKAVPSETGVSHVAYRPEKVAAAVRERLDSQTLKEDGYTTVQELLDKREKRIQPTADTDASVKPVVGKWSEKTVGEALAEREKGQGNGR